MCKKLLHFRTDQFPPPLINKMAWHGMGGKHQLLSVRREQALKAFKDGCISLEERAGMDAACDSILQCIRGAATAVDVQLHVDMQLICRPAVATYHVNFSGECFLCTY